MPKDESLERQRLFMLKLDKVFVNLGLQSGEEVQVERI
jgi:hypothetical protein